MFNMKETHQKMLEILSKDVRASINSIAQQTSISRVTAKKRFAFIENKYNLKYALDISPELLGLDFNAAILVNLEQEIPEDFLKQIISKDYLPQFAAILKGDFELFIYISAKNGKDFDAWEVRIRTELNKYIKSWNVLPVLSNKYGFFPINQKCFEKKSLGKIDSVILKNLNLNSRMPLKELAKKAKISAPLASYHLHKLFKKEISSKLIVSSELLPIQLISLRAVSFPENFRKIDKESKEFLISVAHNICISARTTGNFNTLQMAAFENLEQLNEFESRLKEINKERLSNYKSGIITKVIFGNLNVNPFVKEIEWKSTDYWNAR